MRTRLHARHLALLALLATGIAHAEEAAPNSSMRYAALGAQRDADHNQSLIALLSLPLQERAWVQLGFGQVRQSMADGTRRANVGSLGAGWLGQGWQASLTGTRRDAHDRLEQTDWDATLDLTGDRHGVGLDLHHRDARQQGVGTVSTPPVGTTSVAVRQRVRGHGVGVHGHLQLTDRARVFAAAMRYDYDVSTQAGTGASPLPTGTLLARAPSFVSRVEATLSRSARVAASWRFYTVSLSGEAIVDRLKDDPQTLRTYQLKAAIDLGDTWTLTPSAGTTRSSGQGGSVNFAGLSMTRAW